MTIFTLLSLGAPILDIKVGMVASMTMFVIFFTAVLYQTQKQLRIQAHLGHFLQDDLISQPQTARPVQTRRPTNKRMRRMRGGFSVPKLLRKRDILRAELEHTDACLAEIAGQLEAHQPETVLTAKIERLADVKS